MWFRVELWYKTCVAASLWKNQTRSFPLLQMRLAHFAHFFAPFIFITAQLAQAKPASSLPAASPKSACPEPVWPAHPSKDESCPATGHSSAHSCPHRHVAASYFAGWHADDPTVNLTTSFRKYNTII